MMKIQVIMILTILFVFLSFSWAFGAVEKAVVKGIDFQKDGEEILVKITVELHSTGSGEAYLEASTNYEGKDYTTLPLRMTAAFPYQTFTFLLHKKDFRLVNIEEGTDQELPELAEEKSVTVYIYERKIASPEDWETEDVKAELARRGYALRGVLAKGMKTIKWPSKKQ